MIADVEALFVAGQRGHGHGVSAGGIAKEGDAVHIDQIFIGMCAQEADGLFAILHGGGEAHVVLEGAAIFDAGDDIARAGQIDHIGDVDIAGRAGPAGAGHIDNERETAHFGLGLALGQFLLLFEHGEEGVLVFIGQVRARRGEDLHFQIARFAVGEDDVVGVDHIVFVLRSIEDTGKFHGSPSLSFAGAAFAPAGIQLYFSTETAFARI